MITLYLDMDGVLANFNKRFAEIQTSEHDHIRFRDAVLQFNIFEDLEFMPDAHELLNHVAKLENINVEILTSMGTFDVERGIAAKRQKMAWLAKHGITYKPNFVRTKTEKAQFAGSTSILVDDSIGCIAPYIKHGGHGILHVNAPDSIRIIDATIYKLRNGHA